MIDNPTVNQEVLSGYEENWARYVNNQIPPPQSWWDWITVAQERLSRKSHVSALEIGSGPGRDADFLERDTAWTVQRTDACQGFVDYLRSKGHNAKKLDIIREIPEGKYDMVFASAVFHHFTPAELDAALANIRACLNPGGYLAFAVRRGNNERAVLPGQGNVPRHFTFWRPATLWDRVEVHLTTLAMEYQNWTGHDAVPRGHPNHPDQWLMVTAQGRE